MTVSSKAQICKCGHPCRQHEPNAGKCLAEECKCRNFTHRPKTARIKKNEQT
jgi:hypothetical protein